MNQTVSVERMSPSWAHAFSSQEGFRKEQEQIGKVWTLLGFAHSAAEDGDWFRASLGGRSIFVQRFKDELRGFENVCVHRFFPLRTEDKGNGPIRCGYHHWQYNKDGLAVGIPKCQELFGVIPRELGAKLRPVEIATCGNLIFGRFPSEQQKETLQEYLGPGFDILKGMWNIKRKPYFEATDIKANWRLGHHVSMDDYHIVAVHPSSFGKNGYLPMELTTYFRFGRHSSYFWNESGKAVHKMAEDINNGTYEPYVYRILQFFPNLICVHFEAAGTWYGLLQQYVPVAYNKTVLHSYYYEMPFQPKDQSFFKGLIRRIARPFLPLFIPYFMRKIIREDNEVCERQQDVAEQMNQFPIFGKQEERIAWFEENYAEIVGVIDTPR
jgi:phenylpropionate dioxygenase-like ring-hydroxylating dioxygenase large terminal subunit